MDRKRRLRLPMAHGPDAEEVLAQERGEQQEEVEDREAEEALGLGALRPGEQPRRQRQEAHAAERGDDEIDWAAEAGEGRDDGERDEDQAVDQDLAAGGGLAGGDG